MSFSNNLPIAILLETDRMMTQIGIDLSEAIEGEGIKGDVPHFKLVRL